MKPTREADNMNVHLDKPLAESAVASHECGSVPDDDELRHLVAIKLAEQDGADPFQVIWQGNPPEPYDAVYGEYMGRALEIIAIVKSGMQPPNTQPKSDHVAVISAKPESRVEPNPWQEISTLPYSNDLVWLAHGDSVEGPRPMDDYDYDRYTYWAPCEPPSLGELHPQSGTSLPNTTGQPNEKDVVREGK